MRIAIWHGWSGAMTPDRLGALDRAAAACRRHDAALLVTPEADRAIGIAAHAQLSDGDGPRSTAALAETHGVAILAGFFEDAEPLVHSSALLVARSGEALACYRRTHRRRSEEGRINAGAWLNVKRVEAMRVGLLIGYDLFFPEAARALALSGADTLIAQSGLEDDADKVAHLLRARAIENGLAAVASGAAAIAGPCGFAADGAALEVLPVDDGLWILDLPVPGHAGPEAPAATVLADRRPPIYRHLALTDDRRKGPQPGSGTAPPVRISGA